MIFLTIIISFLAADLISYIFHRFVHNPVSGLMFRAHLEHHSHYTKKRYLSDTYISSGKDSLLYYAVPLFVVVSTITLLLVPSPYSFISVATMAVTTSATGWIHDSSHLTGSRLNGFKWFRTLQRQHLKHHQDTRVVYGVLWFGWDRLFGTYVKTVNSDSIEEPDASPEQAS